MPVGGTAAKRAVLLGGARIASARSRPTLPRATSKAATTLDIADMIAAEIEMHQTRDRGLAGGVAVELDPLDQRRGTVADADDRHADFRHPGPPDARRLINLLANGVYADRFNRAA